MSQTKSYPRKSSQDPATRGKVNPAGRLQTYQIRNDNEKSNKLEYNYIS